jgi:hypothetical protein
VIVEGVGGVVATDGGCRGMISFRTLTTTGLVGWRGLVNDGWGIEFFGRCVVEAGVYVFVIRRDHSSCLGSAT